MRPRSIEINGRRWFRRGPGNTYHSVEIIVDGEVVHVVPYAYGYDQQYEWTARSWLRQAGYLPGLIENSKGTSESLWSYCQRVGCQYQSSVENVRRKKDLHQSIPESKIAVNRFGFPASKSRRSITRRATGPHGRCSHDRCLEHEQNPDVESCLP